MRKTIKNYTTFWYRSLEFVEFGPEIVEEMEIHGKKEDLQDAGGNLSR